jgi:hypothetical protein
MDSLNAAKTRHLRLIENVYKAELTFLQANTEVAPTGLVSQIESGNVLNWTHYRKESITQIAGNFVEAKPIIDISLSTHQVQMTAVLGL